MANISAFIVDDEPLARKGLRVRLADFPQINITGEYGSGRSALEAVREHPPQLLFLDIQMPGLNGFELLREIQTRQLPMPAVIFVTAYDQYAIQAFEVRALDYLLKPVDEERLRETVSRVEHELVDTGQSKHQEKLATLVAELTGQDAETILQELAAGNEPTGIHYPEHIAIKESGEITRVAVAAIEWVDAAGDYMCIHAGDETHILRKTMKELEQELNPKLFQRVHRSAIVNLNQVEKLCSRQNGEYHLVLQNGQELKVSRSYKDRIKKLIAR